MSIWGGTITPLSCAYGPPSCPTCGPAGDSPPITHAASSFAHHSGIQTHPWPRAAGFPFRGSEMDTFGCPAGTMDCGGSCTSTAEGHDAWCGAEAGGAAARLGQRRSSKRICESAQRGWREGGAVSLFGLSAQQHWLTWDHARSRSRAEVPLLLPPALLTIPVVPQAQGMLTAPQQHIKNCSERVAWVHVSKPGCAFQPANPGGCSLPSRLSLEGRPPQRSRGAPSPGHQRGTHSRALHKRPFLPGLLQEQLRTV